jgi:hypothetical protein
VPIVLKSGSPNLLEPSGPVKACNGIALFVIAIIIIIIIITQYCAGGKIEKNEMGGDVARMGKERGVHRVLVGKPEGKRPLGRPRSRWEDNIKMDLQEVGVACGNWMELAQDRDRWRALVSTVKNLWVP